MAYRFCMGRVNPFVFKTSLRLVQSQVGTCHRITAPSSDDLLSVLMQSVYKLCLNNRQSLSVCEFVFPLIFFQFLRCSSNCQGSVLNQNDTNSWLRRVFINFDPPKGKAV